MSDPHESGSYRQALETAEEHRLPGLAVHPGDRGIRAVNATFEQVFGWSNAELEGVDYREIVEPEDHASVHTLLSSLSFGGMPSSETVELLDLSGQGRETKWAGVPNLGAERGGTVVVFCWPTAWREDRIRGALAPLQDRADEAPTARTFDVAEERKGSHSRSLWD